MTLSQSHFQMIFWTSMSFCRQSWMPYDEKIATKKLCHLSYYHMIIYQSNAPLLYDYNFFHIRFEVISYDYSQLCSCLGLLAIDFFIAKDKIPSNGTTNDQPLTMVCYNSIPKDFASKKYQSIMMFETMQWIFSWKT